MCATPAPKKSRAKASSVAFEIRHGHAFIDHKPFELMEKEVVRGVHGVRPVDLAWRNDPHRGGVDDHADRRWTSASAQAVRIDRSCRSGRARCVTGIFSASKLCRDPRLPTRPWRNPAREAIHQLSMTCAMVTAADQ